MPGTTVQGVPLLDDGTSRKAYQEGLMYALCHDMIQEEGASTPLGPLEALRLDRKYNCTIYLMPL